MKIRLQATRYIWVAYALTMIALFASIIATDSGISAGYVLIAGAASLMAFLSTGTIWNWGDLDDDDHEEDQEYDKRKRKHSAKLEQIISRLSDEELLHLKQRLADGDLEEDDLRYMLSDDGELVKFKR